MTGENSLFLLAVSPTFRFLLAQVTQLSLGQRIHVTLGLGLSAYVISIAVILDLADITAKCCLFNGVCEIVSLATI